MVSKRVNNDEACSTRVPAKQSYTLEDWLSVVELLASGYSQNRAAAIMTENGTPMSQQTISARWCSDEGFRTLVADRTAEFLKSGESVNAQTRGLAQLLVHQAMTGERPRTDPTVELAILYLRETDWWSRGGREHKQFGSS